MSRCYSQLDLADRHRLYHFVERRVPISEMGRQLRRHRSTIYREIRRNSFHDGELPEFRGYFPTVADDIRLVTSRATQEKQVDVFAAKLEELA